MNNLKLIKKVGCPHCELVEEYLISQRPTLSEKITREFIDPEIKVVDSPYGAFSSTVPIMISDDYFVSGSENIIKWLEILQTPSM